VNADTAIPELSVVIIARNEEQNIGQCIASVLRETALRRSEILFVDSASTDRTVDIAREYPIAIARLAPERLSPSAGRWQGTRLVHGEYLFFVDGDMMVMDGWVSKAMEALEDPRLAAVAGRLFWVLPGEPLTLGRRDDLPLGRVPGLGGAAVYRRRALEECGGFNPYLRGEEERELAFRLSLRGYFVERVDVPMAYHMDKQRGVEETLERSVYFTGVGQIMRAHAFRPIFWGLLVEHREVFLVWAVSLAIGAAVPVLTLAGATRWLLWPAAVIGCILILFGLWKGPGRLRLYLYSRGLLGVRFVKGFSRGLPHPASFPGTFTWIKRQIP
jgi:glycosyltransferase involved in cell wall biosynthesis